MKKIMMLLVVAVLMLSMSGQAMAAFQNGELIRVVWSTAGTNEVATDLGSVASLTAPSTANVAFTGGNFDFASLGAGANASNSYVTYFALTMAGNPKAQAWLGGPAGGQVTAKSAFNTFSTYANQVGGNYSVVGAGATQVTMAMSDPLSFWTKLNAGGGGIGKLGGFVPAANVAMSLAALSTAGYVDQVLYYYGTPSGISGTSTGVNIAALRTFANGSTQLNPVPIPAAVYLFGSGLLGLAGLRKKMAA